ncbi:MAG: glutamine synthetase family protein [Hyphomonadaceae bacterium]|nr:glutamine synthetase family protein [Hyphomonadaceae bacterium]
MTIADAKECKAFLDAHPHINFFEIVFTNMAGVPRGKRLRRHEIMAVYEQGRFLPGSILVNDITGQDVEATGLVWEDGDADRIARPIAGRLTLAPWLGEDVAQIPVTMYELDGRPHDLDPRHVLQRVLDRFAADGLTPVVACELEYYLVDARRARGGGVQLPRSPLTNERATQHQVYGLREVEEASAFLRELWATADAMGIPLEGAISEYAPGQLELTLKHHADALRAADDAVIYKRAAKGVALRHGCEATFMAKPFAERAGSGMHLHVSVNDAKGKNIMASEAPEGSPAVRYAIGGMKAMLADSMAIYAPNANSYRRFRANSYAPVAPTWGVNNRTVSFRVPAGAPHTRHIEHRVAGADAHPTLAVAALLAAVHNGLTNKIDPGPAIVGDGYAQAAETGERIPTNWFAAVDQFAGSELLKAYLGERFVRMYATVKRTEQERFNSVITDVDYDWYLRTC